MSVARVRVLTQVSFNRVIGIPKVEMSVARVRALTQKNGEYCERSTISRNECCPCEGIDTLQPSLIK